MEQQQTWCKQGFEKQLSPLLSLESLEPWDHWLNILELVYWTGHVEEKQGSPANSLMIIKPVSKAILSPASPSLPADQLQERDQEKPREELPS